MDNLSRSTKAALNKVFPNAKFTFKTIRDSIFIRWGIELGSSITVDAVSAVVIPHVSKKHSTARNAFYLLHSYGIYLEPVITPEVKAAAIAYIKETSDAVWSEKYEYWREESGARNEYAMKRYDYYTKNGITSPLVDEYGHEPAAKRFYYLKQKEATKSTENGCIQLIQL